MIDYLAYLFSSAIIYFILKYIGQWVLNRLFPGWWIRHPNLGTVLVLSLIVFVLVINFLNFQQMAARQEFLEGMEQLNDKYARAGEAFGNVTLWTPPSQP